jgi:hypothetical protein
VGTACIKVDIFTITGFGEIPFNINKFRAIFSDVIERPVKSFFIYDFCGNKEVESIRPSAGECFLGKGTSSCPQGLFWPEKSLNAPSAAGFHRVIGGKCFLCTPQLAKRFSSLSSAIVLNYYWDTPFYGCTWRIIQRPCRYIHVGAELPFFTIVRDPSLDTRKDSSEDSTNRSNKGEDASRIFEPMLFLLGIGGVAAGIWVMLFTARRGGLRVFICGAFILLPGVIIAVSSGILACIAFADHASASLGSFGVSATCYRRAENIRIAPVVIAPFELGIVQRQSGSDDGTG